VVVLLRAVPSTGGPVLLQALATAFESAAPPPFAFAIKDAAHGLAAGRAAEARRVADRHQGRFMATWPTAARRGQNNFCCVTTRRRIRWRLCWLRQRLGTLPARTLRLGVLSLGRGIKPAPGLPLRCLPEAEQLSAFGILAVTLVPAPRLVLAAAALAQADTCPRPSRLGTTLALWLTMTTAHGSVFSQGTARGSAANALLGRLQNRDAGGRRQSIRLRMNQTRKETF
jgi:hypothetical protein